MTLATVLGPRYETPVCKMCLAHKKDNDEELQYLVFATKDIIGLQKLPLDGNPWKHIGMLGHPVKVENLLVEAKYKVYRREPVTEIDFDEFVKLYLNHRPVFGEDFKRIRAAFRNFATIDKNDYSMPRQDFIEILTTTGEHFSKELAWYLLSILSGHSFEDRAVMVEEDFSFLPQELTFSYFVNEIIGMQEMENISEGMSSNVESSAISLLSMLSMDSESD